MILHRNKYPWVDNGMESCRISPVFLLFPKRIDGSLVWLQWVKKIEKIWGWGFLDVNYELFKDGEYYTLTKESCTKGDK